MAIQKNKDGGTTLIQLDISEILRGMGAFSRGGSSVTELMQSQQLRANSFLTVAVMKSPLNQVVSILHNVNYWN